MRSFASTVAYLWREDRTLIAATVAYGVFFVTLAALFLAGGMTIVGIALLLIVSSTVAHASHSIRTIARVRTDARR